MTTIDLTGGSYNEARELAGMVRWEDRHRPHRAEDALDASLTHRLVERGLAELNRGLSGEVANARAQVRRAEAAEAAARELAEANRRLALAAWIAIFAAAGLATALALVLWQRMGGGA